MATVLLVRHGRTAANTSGVLAGWTPGVGLDERGVEQAAALGRRLAAVPLALIASSPLERCLATGGAIRAARVGSAAPNDGSAPADPAKPHNGSAQQSELELPPMEVDERLGECHYGDWTGKELTALAEDPLWKIVQSHPSAAVFPGPDGESMRGMQARAVNAVRDFDARVQAEAGDDAIWVAVSHGDVIKAILADAMGVHLDGFQRLVVDPCSVSVVRYTSMRPFVVRTNDIGGDLTGLLAPPQSRGRGAKSSDAEVGGGAGA